MQVPISQGLTGWTWDHSGNRTAVTGLTNPFWLAVNSLLRAIGLAGAPSGTQLNQIVLSSLVVGDGSGAAEIADTLVTPVVGSGVKKQFRFQGVLAQQKPLRDWLVEILACGLGFFTWEFGKLKLGCRINASAVDAFTLGNILFQSLRLEPIDSSTCSIVLNNIVWPAVAGMKDYVIFAAAQDDLICGQQLGTYGGLVASGARTPTGDGTTYTPVTITFTGPLRRSTFALPSPYVSRVRLKAKHLIHGGIIGATVDSVSAGVLVCGSLKGAPPSSNPSFTPVGRIISIIGRPETATPFFSGRVTS